LPKGEYTCIEKIQLTTSKELHFQLVDQNEEKYYGDIRRFIDSHSFTGYTKKGVQFTLEQLKSLREVLNNINEIENRENTFEIGSIPISDSNSLIIQFKKDKYTNNIPSIDIRKHVELSDYTGFTKDGFRFPLKHRDKFMNNLENLIFEIEKRTNANQKSKDDSSKIDQIKENII